MKISALALLVVLISNLASAAPSNLLSAMSLVAGDAPFSARTTPAHIPPKGSAPISVGFKFPQGKALWDQALMPTEQSLIGEWILIGQASVSWYFSGSKNLFNEKGEQNIDHSIWTLRWSYREDPLSGHDLFSAEFLHQGEDSANQGPYESSVDPVSKSAVASKFSYYKNELSKSYFRLDCRVFPNDADKLVCALTLKLDPTEKSSTAPEQLPFDKVLGGIEILKRVRN